MSFRKESFLLFLPYCSICFLQMSQSVFFSAGLFICYLAIILGLDLLLRLILGRTHIIFRLISVFVISAIIVFLYGSFYRLSLQRYVIAHTRYGTIRGQDILLLSFVVVTVIQLFFIKKRSAFCQGLNYFLLTFFSINSLGVVSDFYRVGTTAYQKRIVEPHEILFKKSACNT